MNNYQIHRTTDNELMHFGVRGQKWGVRRYQNEDGSYKSGAEGRYDPDGKSGHTLKNRIKSAAGIYKDGDGNPYVSEKRRKNRKLEEEMTEKPKTKEKKQNPDDDDKWTQEDLDKYFGKGYFDGPSTKIKNSRQELSSKKAAKNKEKEAEKSAKKQAKEAEKARKKAEKQAKEDAKNEKNSYKKIAGKYFLSNIGAGVAGHIAGRTLTKMTGDESAGRYLTSAVQTSAGIQNLVRAGKEAKSLYDYRKRKSAQHSGFTEYDALYHSASGQTYGIHRTK